MKYLNASQFRESNGYDVEGTWYPRVTKIIGIKSKPALERFLREVGNYESAEEIKNKSAEEGSLVHNAVEKILMGQDEEFLPGILPAVRAFQDFLVSTKILVRPHLVEKRIWSAKYRYAGTVDAVAKIGSKFGVLDIKTSTGFYPEYNLQTAAYVAALQEYELKKTLGIDENIETRWILRIDQVSFCQRCGAVLRLKGGRSKIRNHVSGSICKEEHVWGDTKGETELREFPYGIYKDMKAFVAAKILWEWDNDYWLRQVGYLT